MEIIEKDNLPSGKEFTAVQRRWLALPQKDDHVFLLRAAVREDGCITGTVRRFGLKTEDMSFAGLDSVFLTMNDWMDSEDPPEISAGLRSFKDGRRAVAALRVWQSRTDIAGRPGQARRGAARRKEAFLVRIIYRQHTSWQGEVCWKSQRLYFRSTLELMALMHSALAPGGYEKEAAI